MSVGATQDGSPNRVAIPWRRLVAGQALVLVAAMALAVPTANASRLPTPREAKAISRAFKHERRHRHDILMGIRVSTKDHRWAMLVYSRKPKLPKLSSG